MVTSPSRSLISSKLKAFATHLALSALAVGGLAFITLRVWYPEALADLQGVWKILGLVALVDVVLGPALTFIVFAPGKRTLVLDLSVIAAIQLGALGYGAWTISLQRPAYLAYMYDRFFVVTERDLLDAPPEEVTAIVAWHGGPRPVFVKLSFSAMKEAAAAAATAFDTPPMALLSSAYAPLEAYKDQILDRARADGAVPASGTVDIAVIGRSKQGVARFDTQSVQLISIASR